MAVDNNNPNFLNSLRAAKSEFDSALSEKQADEAHLTKADIVGLPVTSVVWGATIGSIAAVNAVGESFAEAVAFVRGGPQFSLPDDVKLGAIPTIMVAGVGAALGAAYAGALGAKLAVRLLFSNDDK